MSPVASRAVLLELVRGGRLVGPVPSNVEIVVPAVAAAVGLVRLETAGTEGITELLSTHPLTDPDGRPLPAWMVHGVVFGLTRRPELLSGISAERVADTCMALLRQWPALDEPGAARAADLAEQLVARREAGS